MIRTIAAVLPIVVPTIILESGNRQIIKIMKGNDLKVLIIIQEFYLILVFPKYFPL